MGLCLSLSITISGQVVACSGGCQAIVDTGKPLVIGPQSDIDNIDTLVGVTAKNGEVSARIDVLVE